ncbi:MAG: hypothetical protein UW46_C0011G0005 [Candidatus Yanofskybacteria bacterium GW2011_GWF1_44_227]|uniref:Prepilin-type N-terminal cleavage/methylation domain-containing protein n=1 Tax=Candidatus Yanofskybacteria bacterium GW2011_GWE2_40_11 TaxID=1619033 RepID=A0A0G0TRM0_9BACT|nr:MAG: hypothetical protein UT69_C0007G0006 [Candidatus Yanofskybacteria bacterium GW2011_GWE1_40_10]KKR40517.1 MAG: hypothetical protein UT75_C0008G0039 [Candidatus Yanofskybacteria bacterium GW2011_GWE2_40_11]KKT52783.1 MAG: hypothetical protein UW46_C0011G0005 [Candidatus Yanofskybacteria bacterium GW2011_GWF1_44_227]OGN35485.1 MAG: hypothetical protein A2207_01970 [Candidatus Yanofskybacteria bacterium RIFOXYA1_FULL_44_17]OGN36809.1 MAG: hypothetical protein A2241_03405 [Candidatus Yanofsk
MKSNKGFTVIELLLVIAMIGVVAAALLSYRLYSAGGVSEQTVGDEVRFIDEGDQYDFEGKVFEVIPLVGEHKIVGLKVRRDRDGFMFGAVGAVDDVRAGDAVFCQNFGQADRIGRAIIRVCHKIPVQ